MGTRLLVSALAVSVLLLGCGSSRPTALDLTGPNEIRFRDANGQLRDQEAAIRGLVSSALEQVNAVLPLSGVTITVIVDASRTIGGYGIGGRTLDAATVEMYLDPAFLDLERLLPDRLPPLVAHELHHVKRWRGPGYGRTLFEAMVSEALADHFSIELLGAPVPPWSDAFPRDQTPHFLELARPEFDSTSYNHAHWFFGPSPPLPRWTGYTLGYRLVEAYQAEHPGSSAATLVNMPASAFRP